MATFCCYIIPFHLLLVYEEAVAAERLKKYKTVLKTQVLFLNRPGIRVILAEGNCQEPFCFYPAILLAPKSKLGEYLARFDCRSLQNVKSKMLISREKKEFLQVPAFFPYTLKLLRQLLCACLPRNNKLLWKGYLTEFTVRALRRTHESGAAVCSIKPLPPPHPRGG